MKKKVMSRVSPLLVCIIINFSIAAGGEEIAEWPKEIAAEQGTLLVYQPQVDRWEKDTLSSRAAVSYKASEDAEPIFGTIWLVAKAETDRSERMVYLSHIRVPRVHFPGSTPEQEARVAELVEEAVPKGDLSISQDRLLTLLDLAEKENIASQGLSTDPPVIIYRDNPTVLVSIDGEPYLSDVENSPLKRVVNTPFLILYDTSATRYYLYAADDVWYEAGDLKGKWSIAESVPHNIEKLAPDTSQIELPEESSATSDVVPEVIMATEPSELIYTKGKPEYKDLPGTSISYVSNSDSSILRHGGKEFFVLLSGRWFRSKSLEGPWEYVASDKLPEDFARIPSDSEIGDLRYAVAGTEEAHEAVLDAYIPQTAKVDREKVTIKIQYDGKPEFSQIPGAGLQYAVNADNPVLQSGKQYYACVDGVWYFAGSPEGPWQVATERPDGVELIPPESPVYNVKYVYIYDVEPEVVYVGYLPGYNGTYVYHSTIVYGTGWYYRPWYRHYYYPRPATWNFHVRYSPWGGWSFGLGYSMSRFTFGIGFGGWSSWHGGWWGPGRYHGYWRGYNRGYYHGYNRGRHAGYYAGMSAGYRNANLYQERQRPGISSPERRQLQQQARSPEARQRQNDLYADLQGNVYQQRANGEWQQRSQSRGPSASDMSRQQQSRQLSEQQRQTLNRESQARNRGSQRTDQYRSSRPSGQRSRPAGGRGGGGRGGGRR